MLKNCKKLQESYLVTFIAMFFQYFLCLTRKHFSARLEGYMQDLIQDRASLARKILASLAYFLQDGFYWVGWPAYHYKGYSSTLPLWYIVQQHLSVFADHCSFCGLLTFVWFHSGLFNLPSLDQGHLISVSSIQNSFSGKTLLYPAGHCNSI